ncbi:MAG TPA: AI-2E family transporter [Candidatus Gastranaerophilales bacterium]|nr:AI-2E family transporter [Candidatus Gastranaerophilales bacterium]
MDKENIIISPRTLITFLALIVLILFIYQIRDVLLLLFASFVIASALFPLVDWMSKKIPRGLAVLIVYLVGLIALITLLVPFVTVIISQFQDFLMKMPVYSELLSDFTQNIKILATSSGFAPDYSEIIKNMATFGQNIVEQSINFTINVFAGLATAFTLSVIVLFVLLDKKVLKEGYLKIFPPKYREKAKNITGIISGKVGGYVRGQIILMLLVGLLTAAGLKLIGLEFALLLGIIAGILEIIPIAGPVLATVPGVIVALAQDPMLALWALLVYIIVQRLENHILTPMILGKFLELHPLIIIVAILTAGSALGIVGVILSPAIAAAIYVLAQELYIKKLEEQA